MTEAQRKANRNKLKKIAKKGATVLDVVRNVSKKVRYEKAIKKGAPGWKDTAAYYKTAAQMAEDEVMGRPKKEYENPLNRPYISPKLRKKKKKKKNDY